MDAERLVCTYPQYYGCYKQTQCRLYHICSQMPKTQKAFNGLRYNTVKAYRKVRAIPLTEQERLQHRRRYKYYNYLFGDLKEYKTNYRLEHKDEINAKRRKYTIPTADKQYKMLIDYCNYNCENCEYEDCILPEWSNKLEYARIYKKYYYEHHRDEEIERRKKYYEHHRDEEIERRKKYYEQHKAELREYAKMYYEKHKDEINAKKREKRLQQKLEKEKNK